MSDEKASKFAKKTTEKVVVDTKKNKIVKKPITKEAPKPVVEKAKKAVSKKEPVETTQRSSYNDKKISVLKKEHGAREGSVRAALMAAILSAKNTSDVLGTEVSSGSGSSAVVRGVDIKFAVDNGLIKIA